MSGALPFARIAVHLVAGLGVSKVVKDIVVNNTTIITRTDAVRVFTGRMVIASMATAAVTKYVDQHIDKVVAWNEKRKTDTDTTE